MILFEEYEEQTQHKIHKINGIYLELLRVWYIHLI